MQLVVSSHNTHFLGQTAEGKLKGESFEREVHADLSSQQAFLKQKVSTSSKSALCYVPNYFVLAPKLLLDQYSLQEVWQTTFGSDALEIISEELPSLKSVLLTNFHQQFYETIDTLPVAYKKSAAALIIEYLLAQKSSQGLIVLKTPSVVQIFQKKNGLIELVNSFDYKSPQDVVYYVLAVQKQLQVDRSTLECLLLNYLSDFKEEHADLKHYFKRVRVQEFNQFFHMQMSN